MAVIRQFQHLRPVLLQHRYCYSVRQFTSILWRGQSDYGQHQKKVPLNPHLTNTTSTIANELPSVGAQHASPELISTVSSKFKPQDHVPENTKRMSGGTQDQKAASSSKKQESQLQVGEMEDSDIMIQPIRRHGEDLSTMRSRLQYQSRKRGILETDLLLSTFADTHLGQMDAALLGLYDRFLDENDWDIYYWATQEPPATSIETAEGAINTPTENSNMRDGLGASAGVKNDEVSVDTSGEWAQTIGKFKPAYRPVPDRWKDSEILRMLRSHVTDRAGAAPKSEIDVRSEIDRKRGGGLGRMPNVKTY
jgi:succinate dehydrogenase flavin-adding protein (antitoxin of CptAB toxin-antitoxin module)